MRNHRAPSFRLAPLIAAPKAAPRLHLGPGDDNDDGPPAWKMSCAHSQWPPRAPGHQSLRHTGLSSALPKSTYPLPTPKSRHPGSTPAVPWSSLAVPPTTSIHQGGDRLRKGFFLSKDTAQTRGLQSCRAQRPPRWPGLHCPPPPSPGAPQQPGLRPVPPPTHLPRHALAHFPGGTQHTERPLPPPHPREERHLVSSSPTRTPAPGGRSLGPSPQQLLANALNVPSLAPPAPVSNDGDV